jgi:predicted CoA-binding protein
MNDQGYYIIPVHPTADEVLGQRAYPSLAAMPERIDLVNVFRPSHEAPAIVEAAIAKGAPAVWLQQGIVHEGTAARARAAGLVMVMDLCIMQAYRRLMASRP